MTSTSASHRLARVAAHVAAQPHETPRPGPGPVRVGVVGEVKESKEERRARKERAQRAYRSFTRRHAPLRALRARDTMMQCLS